MVKIEVDGRQIEAEEGAMLIEATDAAGIHIPRFCYHDKLSIAANCRMCLVEVTKVPKPLPACATPISEGMQVFTQSKKAREAQKGTLEFLLINHPLDCPVCDQGGECPLQDQAVGYGKSISRYREPKRVPQSYTIGPLIATEMSRCIYCTRCVRFSEEIAGVLEMGAIGRGEHTLIRTFFSQPITSELSGNIIDLCPVGALTSKPSRFAARSWELQNVAAISPHDCLGTNIDIQTLRDRTVRVLPRENEAINQCWLADRDRFSFEAVNSGRRLLFPMIREQDEWKEVDWESALKHAAAGLSTIMETDGVKQIGALAGAGCTFEEFYLLQKLMRSIGCNNVDHRLLQGDFRDDDVSPVYPGIERPIAELDSIKAALLIGSNLRKEQPLLGLRLQQASRNGARVCAINPVDYNFNFNLASRVITDPQSMTHQLARLAEIIAAKCELTLPDELKHWCQSKEVQNTEELTDIADLLVETGGEGTIILGAASIGHINGSILRAISEWIAQATSATLMPMTPANSVAAYIAGCVPHRGTHAKPLAEPGHDAKTMLQQQLKAYILLGCEPVLDSTISCAVNTLEQASFVIQLSSYRSEEAMRYADVLLPMATFSENAGTYINCEGLVQKSAAATTPRGDARPGWKILRVLANFLDIGDFQHTCLADIEDEVRLDLPPPSARLKSWWLTRIDAVEDYTREKNIIQCITEMPMYRGEAILRNSDALQATADNPKLSARLNSDELKKMNLKEGDRVELSNTDGHVTLQAQSDPRIPDDCVLILAGHPETAGLAGSNTAKVNKL